jgi:thioesterase domain-containing protein
MATDHLATVRALQPQGPYRLGGYCNGGLIAFEMARRLQAEGERVDLLVLLDATAHNTGLGARVLHGVVDCLGAIAGLTPRERLRWFVGAQRRIRRLGERAWHYWRRELSESKAGERIAAPPMSPRVTGPVQTHPERIEMVYYRAIAGYVPRRYAGRITIFRAQHPTSAGQHDLGWRAVAREVDVHVIPGDHFTFITRHVRILGEQLSACVQSVERQ